jgi:transposase IS116/IS110/IS902 family protein
MASRTVVGEGVNQAIPPATRRGVPQQEDSLPSPQPRDDKAVHPRDCPQDENRPVRRPHYCQACASGRRHSYHHGDIRLGQVHKPHRGQAEPNDSNAHPYAGTFRGQSAGDTEVLSYLRSPQAALEDSVAALRERSQRDADPSLKALLSSIPRIGPVIATILIAEIGSIDRFKDAKALVGVCRARSEGSAERYHPQTKYASDQALLAVSATRGVFLRRDRLTLRSGIEKILLEEPKRGVALPRSNGGNRSQAPLPHLCGVETRHVLHD